MSCLNPQYDPNPTRVWSRVQHPCSFGVDNLLPTTYIPYLNKYVPTESVASEIAMINKGNILQYKANSSGLTKQQRYSKIAKGMWTNRTKSFASQTQTYTNPNTGSLKRVNAFTSINVTPNTIDAKNTAICPGGVVLDGGNLICNVIENNCTGEIIQKTKQVNCFPTSASDVPGPIINLCYNTGLPTWYPRQQYTMPVSGNKFPQGYKGFVSANGTTANRTVHSILGSNGKVSLLNTSLVDLINQITTIVEQTTVSETQDVLQNVIHTTLNVGTNTTSVGTSTNTVGTSTNTVGTNNSNVAYLSRLESLVTQIKSILTSSNKQDIQKLVDILSEINSLTSTVQDSKLQINPLLVSILQQIQSTDTYLNNTKKEILNSTKSLDDKIGLLKSQVSDTSSTVKTIIDQDTANILTKSNSNSKILSDKIDTMTEQIKTLGESIILKVDSGLTNNLNTITSTIDSKLTTNIDTMTEQINTLGESIKFNSDAGLMNKIDNLVTTNSQQYNAVTSLITNSSQQNVTMYNDIRSKIEDLNKLNKKYFNTLLSNISNVFTTPQTVTDNIHRLVNSEIVLTVVSYLELFSSAKYDQLNALLTIEEYGRLSQGIYSLKLNDPTNIGGDYELVRLMVANSLESLVLCLRQHFDNVVYKSKIEADAPNIAILNDYFKLVDYVNAFIKNARVTILPDIFVEAPILNIKPELLQYIELYGFPADGIFDVDKLAQILKTMQLD